MPLDHYISQVHLKNFYNKNNRLIGINKNTLIKFQAKSENVCRISEGNTNEYLIEQRAVEYFLKNVEPKYNSSISALRSRNPDRDAIYVISGFVAYIMACSPTAMRIGKPLLSASLQTFAERMEARGEISPAPEILGSTSLSELLDKGLIEINIDEKYPQAIGISNIMSSINSFGNATWEIFTTDRDESSFFTSDFPIGFGLSNDSRVVSKTVPLAPDLAVRIHPRIQDSAREESVSFEKFSAKFKKIKLADTVKINRQIVRSAENIVFYNKDEDWIVPFVNKNRNYRAETAIDRIPTSNGTFILGRQRIMPFSRPLASAT